MNNKFALSYDLLEEVSRLIHEEIERMMIAAEKNEFYFAIEDVEELKITRKQIKKILEKG